MVELISLIYKRYQRVVESLPSFVCVDGDLS